MTTLEGRITAGMEGIKRLVRVDQKPIGRTPRSNLATYTGLFDHIRKLFAATPEARSRQYDAGWFSFNVAKGRCENCQGEGFVMVELLFLPSVYAPCPVCQGDRYNPTTLEIKYREEEHRRCSGADGRRGLRDVYRGTAGAPFLERAAGCRTRLPFGSASLRPSSPAERRNGSSSRPNSSARNAATRSMCSTSLPPGAAPIGCR